MEIAKIKIIGTAAVVSEVKTITSGMIGATVGIEYDNTWDGLQKQVVFKTAFQTVNADGCTVPPELLRISGINLLAGVYGYTDDGSVAIPTVWASLGSIQSGADPEGDEAAKPTLPVWARMQAQITGLESAFDELNSVLPAVTAEDAGKALVVSADGRIVADDGISEEDVLAEQVLIFAAINPESPENPYEVMSDGSFYHFQTGGTYYVVWDGTVYPCVAANLDTGPEKIIYIGNIGILGMGEDTGEPFLFGDIYTVVDDSGGAVLSASGGYTNSPDLTLTEVSHTVRIYQRVKAVPYYTKAEIDAALGSYINDIDALIGDISAVTGEA